MLTEKRFLTLSLSLLGLSLLGFVGVLWAKFGTAVFLEMALNRLANCF